VAQLICHSAVVLDDSYVGYQCPMEGVISLCCQYAHIRVIIYKWNLLYFRSLKYSMFLGNKPTIFTIGL